VPGDPYTSDTDDDHRIDFEHAPNEFFLGFIEIVDLRDSSSEHENEHDESENENEDKESDPDESSESDSEPDESTEFRVQEFLWQ
jgi:hypothetical protein